MSLSLFLCSILFSFTVIVFILYLLRKSKIRIKYSLVWLCLFFLLMISLLIPGFLEWLTRRLGFQTPSNMVLSLLISVLIFISIVLTVVVSTQDKKIRLLIQEISMLKKEVKDKDVINAKH